jgi:hypothetical protein
MGMAAHVSGDQRVRRPIVRLVAWLPDVLTRSSGYVDCEHVAPFDVSLLP